MFDENFSFLASASTVLPDRATEVDLCPSDPSPFSSRCSSPVLESSQQIFSLAFRQRDRPWDSRPKSTVTNKPRQPMTTLTTELQTRALQSPTGSSNSSTSRSAQSTPNTELEDAGDQFDILSCPDTSLESANKSFDPPSPWELTPDSDVDSLPCSVPAGLSIPPSFALRRRQRQALGRLQCLARKAPGLAMLIEECHPSSLPVMERDRARSITSACGGRIEKERRNSTKTGVVKRLTKVKKECPR
jgi:hypothetical protein